MDSKLNRVFRLIDEANSQDPNREAWQGGERPKELLYGQRMSAWIETLSPQAGEPAKIAARGQHICRWQVPRDSYPKTRPGYLAWRTFLYKFHGDKIAELMEQAGYGLEERERVRRILLKKDLKKDPDSQLVEDAACLVFLEYHFADFAKTQPQDKIIAIVRKTWAKMSPAAQKQALALRLPPDLMPLVEKALAG